MFSLPRVTIVLGTRPEAIKLAPVIKVFQACKVFSTRVVLTGQHREMVAQVMDLFGLQADHDLDLMKPRQSLTHVTCSALKGLRDEFRKFPADLVLVQGDTSTAFSAALAAFYEQIPVGHVEAGLRTENLMDPFPEEANRRLISQIASLNFAPTALSASNLTSSGVIGDVFITGNTVIDALLTIAEIAKPIDIKGANWENQRVIFTTVHRRENWGDKLIGIADGISRVLDSHHDVSLLLPLHKNPIVREPLEKYFGNNSKVFLTEPLSYDRLVAAVKRCCLLLTDSGGLQEEAPALGKPVLVLRETTERPEAVEAGTAVLVGTQPEKIASIANNLLNDPNAYNSMARVVNPFGDGKASRRILKACRGFLNI
ncbi:non-hydrolyzing UDP-N-acetylglucosamine 2-epimerase [Prochlorococcus sp. MIT 1300]|uniref:non-hydrolyzing UDP-N-acetylglucosamine 2-epimerase n=1 Tax=Prochlorococcus sp. MIT 1300 TaxID=3096218 RepID=UPI002A75B2DE|nr:UDP-N-acetylglucosamine 2-epimerase (non-hydrolyzing) [Prochlorococcus sp. MIT 1300]